MIFLESTTSFKISQKRVYKKWIQAIAGEEGKRVGDIYYLFCDDNYLLSINQHYLQHDTYTDIITFDYSEEKIISGDVFISIDRVRENAEKFSVDFHEELLRVISHGIFHLCGYKDKTKQEEKKMREKENHAIQLFKKSECKNTNSRFSD